MISAAVYCARIFNAGRARYDNFRRDATPFALGPPVELWLAPLFTALTVGLLIASMVLLFRTTHSR